MNTLNNDKKDMCIALDPILQDDFGFLCNFKIESEVLNMDFKDANEKDRYFSHENIAYLKEELKKLDRLEDFEEETEQVTSIPPIDMFFSMNIFKASEDALYVRLKSSIGVYTSSKIAGYGVGLDFFVYLHDFKVFWERFLDACQRIYDHS